jgi:hypothetical protein
MVFSHITSLTGIGFDFALLAITTVDASVDTS